MIRPQIRFGRAQQDDLATVCQIGPELLSQVADDLASRELLIGREQVEQVIYAHVSSDKGEHLSRLLFGVAPLLRHGFVTVDELLNSFQGALKELSEDDKRLARWPECRPALERLLSSRSIRAAAKALDVSYDFERIYLTGRFLTSIRPIFDSDREEIVGTAVVQTLRLEFTLADGRSQSLSVAMDKADIQQLMRSCDEALRKGDIAAREVRASWKMPTIMAGEDS